MEGVGLCHLCHRRAIVRWCAWCQHFFCEDCRSRYWARGKAAVAQMIGGRYPGCCGLENRVNG